MHIQGKIQVFRQADEPCENLALHVPLLFFLDRPVIQAHLANGGQLCPVAADERVHLFGLIAVEKGGIQPGRGLYHGELLGKIKVSFRIRHGFADRDDGPDSRRASSRENLAQVMVEFRAAQVGVGVDEGEES